MTQQTQLHGVAYIAPSSIIVQRISRQRRVIEITADGFADDIKQRGVLVPLLCNRSGPGRAITLVYGERRLTAAIAGGLEAVPVVFTEDLDEGTLREIELMENLKRSDLAWRDEVRAVKELHGILEAKATAEGADWSAAHTRRALGISQILEMLDVADHLDDPRLGAVTGVRAAWNIISRWRERATADMMNDLTEVGAGIFDSIAAGALTGGSPNPSDSELGENPPGTNPRGDPGTAPTALRIGPNADLLCKTPNLSAALPPSDIITGEFASWAEQYTGPKFNFIHCDFPYGRQAFGGPMSGRDKWISATASGLGTGDNVAVPYDDSPDVYWELIRTFCLHLDRFMMPSAHLLFWLDAEPRTQHKTIELFRALAPSLVFLPKPIIWWKTDNVGVLSDAKRRPRHVYETALIASREDRLIVRSVSDCYGAPTNKDHHPSTKPEPVLRHFMSMFVDENCSVLDPTCGSGSALRAAESLGARRVFGIERDPEWADAARSALKTFRNLRAATR